MRRSKLPIVNGRYMENSENDPMFMIGDEEWNKWIETAKGFRYIPVQEGWTLNYDITVYKRDTGFWYAYRRVNNKLRQTYLGKSEALDFDALQTASIRLSLGDVEWYKMKKNKKVKQ